MWNKKNVFFLFRGKIWLTDSLYWSGGCKCILARFRRCCGIFKRDSQKFYWRVYTKIECLPSQLFLLCLLQLTSSSKQRSRYEDRSSRNRRLETETASPGKINYKFIPPYNYTDLPNTDSHILKASSTGKNSSSSSHENLLFRPPYFFKGKKNN